MDLARKGGVGSRPPPISPACFGGSGEKGVLWKKAGNRKSLRAEPPPRFRPHFRPIPRSSGELFGGGPPPGYQGGVSSQGFGSYMYPESWQIPEARQILPWGRVFDIFLPQTSWQDEFLTHINLAKCWKFGNYSEAARVFVVPHVRKN